MGETHRIEEMQKQIDKLELEIYNLQQVISRLSGSVQVYGPASYPRSNVWKLPHE